jgi:ubiquinone/menaquinone biosynthesis C-methylase UbiE
MRLLAAFLRTFFYLLYHQFAWSYDLVANLVSLGRWKKWIVRTLPYIHGGRLLELGHGPGHLQPRLLDRGTIAVGLDESQQMGRITYRRLKRQGYAQVRLVRGLAQNLPFPAGEFDSVIATFPSEYVLDVRTLSEVHRVLQARGRFVLLPVAWITGKSLPDRFLAWLFRFTGQVPDSPVELFSQQAARHFQEAGFQLEIEQVEVQSSLVLIMIASKSDETPTS